MSGAVSPVTGRTYGLAAVCRVWRMPRATIYRHRAAPRLNHHRARGRSDRCRTRRCSMRSAPSWPTAPFTARAPQGLGAAARPRRAHLKTPGAAADARERSAGPAPRRRAARSAQP